MVWPEIEVADLGPPTPIENDFPLKLIKHWGIYRLYNIIKIITEWNILLFWGRGSRVMKQIWVKNSTIPEDVKYKCQYIRLQHQFKMYFSVLSAYGKTI